MTDKHFWPFFITGLIIVWAVPLFAHWLDDAMAAYWLGVALAWLWREWVQREIDKRRRASDERAVHHPKCDHGCGFHEPFGWVISADCPLHDEIPGVVR